MDTATILLPSCQDSAWKDILDVYFEEFMTFFYPAFADCIDWRAGYQLLDKELHAILPDATVGHRFVDKLVQVCSLQGENHWVLLHVEIQGKRETEFAQRLFEYYYRLYDRYRQPILTLVVLTDNQLSWRPKAYQATVWNYPTLTFQFYSVKLLDYQAQQGKLDQTANPFGTVVLAQLAALQSQQNVDHRLQFKKQLTRRLYERGYKKQEIINLYKFIDWILILPRTLEIQYNDYIHQLEEEKTVGYITTAERIGLEKGLLQGRQEGRQEGRHEGEYELLLRQLQRKFHQVPAHYQQRLSNADAETLLIWGERVLDAQNIEEIFIGE